MKNLNTVVYYLSVEDVQTVASQEIDRTLSATEIESLKELVASNLNWYDAISNAIHQKINAE